MHAYVHMCAQIECYNRIFYVQEELSQEQKKKALSKIPSLLEVAGYTYFPASFLVGPQFSMRRYLDFVAGIFRDEVEVQ